MQRKLIDKKGLKEIGICLIAFRYCAYLWQMFPSWLPTHELQGRDTAFGWIGSAGHARVRELARNDCPGLRGKGGASARQRDRARPEV
jgi:hypothetical protein